MQKEYLLVTGAAGFIGSAVAAHFLKLGFAVITIDNLSTGKREVIPEDVIFIEGDAGNAFTVKELEQFDISGIIHIAGQSSGEVSFEDPEYDLRSNTNSTLLLLDYAKRKRIKQFVFASTMSVYGNQHFLPVTENTIPNPVSFYAVGKLASENYMRIFSKFGISSIALRLFNVYGPGQNMDNLKQGMLSIYMAQAIHSNEITVKGSLDRFRDFIYINDVVNAFEKAFSKTKEDGIFEIYNVCSGAKTHVRELLELIVKHSQSSIKVNVIEGTPGDQFGIFGSPWRVNVDLNWRATVELKDGLEQMMKWAIKQ
jgi:UDP-glucose 4-epimerase